MNILHDYKKETFSLEKLNELALSNPDLLIKDAEALYRKQIDDVVNDITKNGGYKIHKKEYRFMYCGSSGAYNLLFSAAR